METMTKQLSEAVLLRDALLARSIVISMHRARSALSECPCPRRISPDALIVSAALLELLASRWGLVAPVWTQAVGGLSMPFYVTSLALRSARERAMCERESPLPLKRRNVFAPGEFLTFA